MTGEPTEHQGNAHEGHSGERLPRLQERRPGLYAAIVIGVTVFVVIGLALLGLLAFAAFAALMYSFDPVYEI